jgi:hypothetical protein
MLTLLSNCDIYKKITGDSEDEILKVKYSYKMENVPKQIQIPWGTSKTDEENASEFTGSLGKKLRLQKYTNKKILHRS